MQLLDVTAFPPKSRGKKAARRLREEPRRRCRRGRGSFRSHMIERTAGTPARCFSDSNECASVREGQGENERGTAAPVVPVRQLRVAELDDDVVVLSSGQLEETKRDSSTSTKSGAESTRARTQLGVVNRQANFARRTASKLRRVKHHVFSGHGGEAVMKKKARNARVSHLGNLTSDCSVRVSFTGARTKRSRPFSKCDANHSKKWSRARKRVTKTGEAKGKRASGTNTSRTQKQFPPPKRSKAS